jgi:ABC-type Mn2+/Zn2+ transport system permease subunit
MKNLLDLLLETLQYGFMLKALLVGSLIALCCSFLGIFLVLRKYAMIGHGLAHVSFATIAIALLIGQSPLLVSIPLVILSSFLILKLSEKANIHGDSSLGLVSSFAVALGVLISSLANGFNVDLFSYLFGSILVISDIDVYLSVILSMIVLFTTIFFYQDLFAITYDDEFAKVSGVKVKRMNYLISLLTSVTIVLGIRVVGTMLISSMIVFPTVSALQLSKGFKATIYLSSIVAVSSVILGVFLSFVLDLPTGATIVMLNGVFFVIFFTIKKISHS